MKKLLVTGGTGFIGSHLIKCLEQNEEYVVYVFSRHEHDDYENVHFIAGDVLDVRMISRVISAIKPDILVITGHDAYYEKLGDKTNINNYKNSKYFIESVRKAREYESSHEKLVIIAGACQSDYEDLIKSGSNYASSPKRVNIHALDPAIIATNISLTDKNKTIDIKELLNSMDIEKHYEYYKKQNLNNQTKIFHIKEDIHE